MVNYKEITAHAQRKPIYTDRHVQLPPLTTAPFTSQEYEQWVEDNWWMVNYAVFMDDRERAKQLAKDLQLAFKQDPNHPDIPVILEKLRGMKTKSRGEMSALEKWTRSAYQLASYAGDYDVIKTIESRLDRYSGTVLEAMCGHTSYFKNSSERTVTTLDYCEISLERYPYPDRRRIMCDLDQIRGNNSLSFFNEGHFDAISICFGFKYPKHIGPLVREFLRILKDGGTLSFIENPHHAYEDICKRHFRKKSVKEILLRNGYRLVTVKKLRIPSWDNHHLGNFYHVEAIK